MYPLIISSAVFTFPPRLPFSKHKNDSPYGPTLNSTPMWMPIDQVWSQFPHSGSASLDSFRLSHDQDSYSGDAQPRGHILIQICSTRQFRYLGYVTSHIFMSSGMYSLINSSAAFTFPLRPPFPNTTVPILIPICFAARRVSMLPAKQYGWKEKMGVEREGEGNKGTEREWWRKERFYAWQDRYLSDRSHLP